MSGDTVWVERSVIRDRVRTVRDTVWEAVVMSDTVYRDRVTEKPVIVEKDRRLTWWERVRLWPGWMVAATVLAAWTARKLLGRLAALLLRR